jgi:hypothetical protein
LYGQKYGQDAYRLRFWQNQHFGPQRPYRALMLKWRRLNPLDQDSIAGQWQQRDNVSSLVQDRGAKLKALIIIVNIVTYQFVILQLTCVVGRASRASRRREN